MAITTRRVCVAAAVGAACACLLAAAVLAFVATHGSVAGAATATPESPGGTVANAARPAPSVRRVFQRPGGDGAAPIPIKAGDTPWRESGAAQPTDAVTARAPVDHARQLETKCVGLYVGTSNGESNVVHDGVPLDFDPKKDMANYQVTSTTFWYASVSGGAVPMTMSVAMATPYGAAHCTPSLSAPVTVANTTWASVTVSYNCSGVGQFKLLATLTLGGRCESEAVVVFNWYKTRGSAFMLGTTSGGSDVVNNGVTAPSWVNASSHFYTAYTNELVLYAQLGPAVSGQSFTGTGVLSTPQELASPTVTSLPSKLTNSSVKTTVTFACKNSGTVSVDITIHFFPFAPSSFGLSFHCFYVANLQATVVTMDDASVVTNGVTHQQWQGSGAIVRPFNVYNDTFVFQNTGPNTATFKPLVVTAEAKYGGRFCTADVIGAFAKGGPFAPESTQVLTIMYDCPANMTGAWTVFTMTLTPDSALRSVISWEKVSGARTGFNVNWPGASAVGEGSMHDVVTNGLVHPQWASTGLTTPAVSTLGAASWGVKLNMSQAGYPAFELQHTPIVTATGIMKNVDPHGIIPIAEGQVMLTAHVGAPSDLNILFWSKDSEQEAVVNVQLEMPYFAPVTFAFNKMLRWNQDLTLVASDGSVINANGEGQAKWGTTGIAGLTQFDMVTREETFSIEYSGMTGSVSLGAPIMMMNTTGVCKTVMSGAMVEGGIVLTPEASATSFTMHFNCSNVNAVTLYTMAVPINSTDPEYSPLLWQFLYVSSPSYPTTPASVSASASSHAASVSCTSDFHDIPVDLAHVTSHWPCTGENAFVNSTDYTFPVAGGSPFSFAIDGLANGRSYAFTVQLHNGAGWSGVSARSNCVTPQYDYSTIVVLASCGGGVVVLISVCLCYKYGCCENLVCSSDNAFCARVCPCCKCRVGCPCCPRRRRAPAPPPAKPRRKKDKKKKKRRRRRRKGEDDHTMSLLSPLLDDGEGGGGDYAATRTAPPVPGPVLSQELSSSELTDRGSGGSQRSPTRYAPATAPVPASPTAADVGISGGDSAAATASNVYSQYDWGGSSNAPAPASAPGATAVPSARGGKPGHRRLDSHLRRK